jgi:flagellar hook-associated protein 3 FlgL
MGSIRVTQGIMVEQVLRNLNKQELSILSLQEQLSTGLRVNRPSDDPLAARRGISARTEVLKSDQYLANISSSTPYLVETESVVLTSVEILQRAKDLTLQGANGTNAQLQRDQIALEVDQLLEGLLEQANHITNGRYIFGGTRTLAVPFAETRNAQGEITNVTYAGNDEHIRSEVSDGVLVNVNETGQDAFLAGGNVFQTLIDVRDNLRSGNVTALTTRLMEIDARLNNFFVSTARLGANTNRVDRIESNHRDIRVQLEKVVSDNLDADFAEVIVSLNAQSNAFQASLNAAGRVIQPSLLQFLA